MDEVEPTSRWLSASNDGIRSSYRDSSGDWLAIAEAADESEALASAAFLREKGIDAERGTGDAVLAESRFEDVPGVFVWVQAAEFERAKSVLQEWATPPALKGCPKCGSTEIYRNKRITIYEWVFAWFHWATLSRMISEKFGAARMLSMRISLVAAQAMARLFGYFQRIDELQEPTERTARASV